MTEHKNMTRTFKLAESLRKEGRLSWQGGYECKSTPSEWSGTPSKDLPRPRAYNPQVVYVAVFHGVEAHVKVCAGSRAEGSGCFVKRPGRITVNVEGEVRSTGIAGFSYASSELKTLLAEILAERLTN